jgi:hypothetical protein
MMNYTISITDESKVQQILDLLGGFPCVKISQNKEEKSLDESYEVYGRQVMDLIKKKNIPNKRIEVNEKGHIIVDKNKDPELYDWAVNG